ncbi:hypothetical protein ABVK25_004959 [Lepraria finkii]|uniref:Uncharacterized protein n=1 Tax=Lepraria finkii TaxID=1340010 RepID=A0ABR4B9W2_9LECA
MPLASTCISLSVPGLPPSSTAVAIATVSSATGSSTAVSTPTSTTSSSGTSLTSTQVPSASAGGFHPIANGTVYINPHPPSRNNQGSR